MAHSFCLRRRFQRLVTLVHENWGVVKTRRLFISSHFCGLKHTIFWLRSRFQRLVTLGTRKLGRRQNSSIWSFMAVFVGYKPITHSFWLRGRFQWLVTPSTRKFGRRQNSSIWSFLAVFVGYSTQFLAPEMRSTALDPGYAKIGRR